MSLLGIDVGTTGCKAACFSGDGRELAVAYAEYDVHRPAPGLAELDPRQVWPRIVEVARRATAASASDPVQALAVSSMGEAVVPVGRGGEVLGPSILNFDARGGEYLPRLREAIPDDELYRLNGNTLAKWFSLPKLLWIRDHQPELYERADKFLHWASWVTFSLGAEPSIDYALANRSLLFDLDHARWSSSLASRAGIDLGKLPRPVPAAAVVGRVSTKAAAELGVPAGIPIAAGTHDQCANAVGSGVIAEGAAMCGMGTYLCVVPVFSRRPDAAAMVARGLCTEHHAAPGLYVSFLYNHGGSILKWFRDTFAKLDKAEAAARGEDAYDALMRELPAEPSELVVLPRFAPIGPPDYAYDAAGTIAGMTLETTRGDVLRALLEGTVFHVRELVEGIEEAGVRLDALRAVGGGSRSAAWVQIISDVLGKPVMRPRVSEAGSLGAAIIAGVACRHFGGFPEGVEAMVAAGDRFEPDPRRVRVYDDRYRRFQELWSRLKGWAQPRG